MSRRGFTLGELLAALAIAGIVATAATLTLVRQQKFYSATAEQLDVRAQLRDAGDVLASDIRGSAVATYGVTLMTDSAIELYTTIGTSVACGPLSAGAVGLAPSVLANGNTLTSLLATPDTGDLAVIFTIPSGNIDSARWEARRILSFTTRTLASTCPVASEFTTPADAASGVTAYQLTVASPPVADARPGAPVRFLRRARYSLYKSSDKLWYLGYRRCSISLVPACATIQPLSGPYRPYASGSNPSGLSFRYYDAQGVELTSGSSSGTAVARVDIALRGESSRAIALTGDAAKTFRDSTIVSVSPRNRKW